jgi:predicted transcriptional regulator
MKMMMNKKTILNILETLDDEFDTEVLIEKLLFVKEIEKGLKDVSDGRVMPFEEAKRKLEAK